MPIKTGDRTFLISLSELLDEIKHLDRKFLTDLGIQIPALEGLRDRNKPEWESAFLRCQSGVTFSRGSIGNCGTVLISGINFGTLLAQADLFSADSRPLRPVPSCFMSSFGAYESNIYYLIHQGARAYSYTQTTNGTEVVNNFLSQVKDVNSMVISDSVNRPSGFRYAGKKSVQNDTAAFMDLLEKSKIGYLVKSPISLNPAHNSGADFSIIRHWIYYPPGSIVVKASKYLGSGTPIPDDPEELVKNLDKYPLLKSSLHQQKYTPDFFVAAFKRWRDGYKEHSTKVDKGKKV